MFSACKGCGLAPTRGTLNDHGLCCGCHDKLKCRMCRRYLGPHLYSDGDGTICNACVKKSTERGGSSVYKALRETLKQHVFEGGTTRVWNSSSTRMMKKSDAFFSRRRRHKQVTHLQSELVFIFIFQGSGTYFYKIKFYFILFIYYFKCCVHLYVSGTIRWYVTAEISFSRESIQGDEQTTAKFRTSPEITADVSAYDPKELLLILFINMANFLSVGSGWRFDSVQSLAISLCPFRPTIGAGSFIDTPKFLYKKGVLNIQNLKYEYCFL